jgi:hypothetical protein
MARNLHRELLGKVFNAPNNLFFDVRPIAKLLGNLTKDMNSVDTKFFQQVDNILVIVS